MNSSSNSEDSPLGKNIDLDAIKNLRPLKEQKFFKSHKRIKMDSKFLNQIPYVLVTSSDLSNNTFSECDAIKSNEEDIFKEISNQTNSTVTSEDENFRTQTESDKLNMKPLKQKNDLHNIQKHLVVNISRMNIEKYLVNNESDQDRQDLTDKCDTLQSLNQTEEDITIVDGITESRDNIIGETEISFDIKNKRKSVSFAEDKNIEIEYLENNSNINPRNQSNPEEDSEVIGKKLSKGILKRDENMGQDIETSVTQNKELPEEVDELEALNTSTTKEVEETNGITQNEEDEHISQKASKLKERNRRNSYLIDENTVSDNSDSDNENLCKLFSKSELQKEAEIDENDKMKEENNYKKKKRNKKPKPLSKKKKQHMVIEIIGGDDTDVNHVDNNQCITRRDSVGKSDISEAATSEQSDETALKGENAEGGNGNALVIPEPSVDIKKIKSGNVKKEKPKPLPKKKKSVDKEISSESGSNIGKDNGIATEHPSEEKTECKAAEESKPKKVELNDKSERVGGEVIFNDENQSDSNVKNVCSEFKEQDANIQSDEKLKEDDNKDVNETEEPAEENESESVSNENGCSSEEIGSSDLNLETDEVTKNTNVSEHCEEVLNKNEVDIDSTDSDKNNLKSITDGSSKSDPISDSDVSQLVSKYLNDQDVDNTLKEATNHSKKYDESVDGNNIDEQKIESTASSSFNEFQKNDELGISEEDNENINSLISRIFPSDLSDIDENNLEDETNKRKVDDDELNASREKKKKKVTFCEDVT